MAISIRTAKRTIDGRRVWPTLEQALAAQDRQARVFGVFSGTTKVAEGFALLHDVWDDGEQY